MTGARGGTGVARKRRSRARRPGLLKIGELAQRTDTPKETIHYYLRLGLLSKPVETSRNMAYYGQQHVDELKQIVQLRAESYLPLDKIKVLLDEERQAASARARDLAGDLFGRGAKLALEPLDAAELSKRSGLAQPLVEEAVQAGLLGREGGTFGWEDLRMAEVMAEAGGEALLERLHILDQHVRAMVDDELRHFFAMTAAGMEPEEGIELLHGGRQTIGRLLTLTRARRMRQGIERVLAEVDALARRRYTPAPPLPEVRRAELGEPEVRARLVAAQAGGPDDVAARHALLRHLLLQGEHAAALALAQRGADAVHAAEAAVELGHYPEAIALIEPVRAATPARERPPLVELIWSAAVLARLRDALGQPGAANERASPWSTLGRLRGDVVRDLLAGLTTLARVGPRIAALDDPLEVARAQLLLGRVYVGTPRFLELHAAGASALDAAEAALDRAAGSAHDPGLGVIERLRAVLAQERAALAAAGR